MSSHATLGMTILKRRTNRERGRMTTSVFIALGSNLDNPTQHVLKAFDDLAALPHTQLLRCSSLYLTEPLELPSESPTPKQPNYINAVAQLTTTLSPTDLLHALWEIEKAHGRVCDGTRWGPRPLDLDILLYGNLTLETPELTIPHPGMMQRDFVLIPLREIAPDLILPAPVSPVVL